MRMSPEEREALERFIMLRLRLEAMQPDEPSVWDNYKPPVTTGPFVDDEYYADLLK